LESSSTSSTQWQRHIGGLIAVYCSIRNDTETVDIYFMDDQRWQAEAYRVWSPLECKNLVRAEFSKWPRYRKYLDAVTLKTRADYLAEAVKDEYSEEELEAFRQAEKRSQDREKEREKEREMEREKEERTEDTDVVSEAEPPEE
jgi:hypothetical protein